MPLKGYYCLLFLLIFSYSINAQNLLEREIDFSIENATVSEALKQLSAQTKIPLSFSSSFFSTETPLTLEIKQQSVKQILDKLLVGQPLVYKLQGQRILIYKAKPQTYTLSGYLEDAGSGERLIAGTIYCKEHGTGTTSNEYGFFSLTLPKGDATITINYLGYAPNTTKYLLNKNIQTEINLQTGYDLPEIIVQPNSEERDGILNEAGAYELAREKIEALPSVGGEADLMKSAQLLPGIQAPIDGLGGLIIRGGSNGQNLLLLDGVPVYIPYHMLGIYSIYNNRTINSAQVLKGSFPARYGGRLSSVFDVRTREGNKYQFNAEGGINLTISKLLIEGPLAKGKGSFLVAARKSFAGILLEPSLSKLYFQTEEGSLESAFFDINLKLNYNFSAKDRVFVSLFSGGDEFSKKFSDDSDEDFQEDSEFELYWANIIGSIRWNHLFSNKLFLNTTLTYSWFDYEQTNFDFIDQNDPDQNDELSFFDSRSENRDFGINFDFNWLPNTNHNLRFGAKASKKAFVPEVTYFNEEDDELIDLEAIDINSLQALVSNEVDPVTEIVLYAEDQFTLSKKLSTNVGLRGTSFLTETQNFYSLEPRLSFRYQATPQLAFKLGTGQMKQYLHLISNTAFSLPNDLWTPSSEDILPQSAWQSEIGVAMDFNNHLHVAIDAYYKKMDNLYAYPDNSDFLNLLDENDIDEYLTPGSGEAYGLESFLKYSGNNGGFKFGLSVSKARRKFEEQNLGLSYPFEYDYPIQSNIFVYRKFGKNFQASLHWVYQSANPKFQFEVQALAGNDPTLFNPLGQKNQSRGSAFHRLDAQITYSKTYPRFSHKISVGANNIYNRENAAYFILGDNNEAEPIYSLPLLPSISYAFRLQKLGANK